MKPVIYRKPADTIAWAYKHSTAREIHAGDKAPRDLDAPRVPYVPTPAVRREPPRMFTLASAETEVRLVRGRNRRAR